jgi:hypothetical protein
MFVMIAVALAAYAAAANATMPYKTDDKVILQFTAEIADLARYN